MKTNDSDIAAAIARLEKKLDELLAQKRKPKRALLSFSQAAAILGVSRNDTLHEWVAAGRVKAVKVNGRWKIPATEIERIQREGVTAA